MWEDCFEVHRISVLESQQFGVRQGQKVLTEGSGPLIRAKGSHIYRPISLIWSAPDFENAPS